jgi:hypothetical protein
VPINDEFIKTAHEEVEEYRNGGAENLERFGKGISVLWT